MNLLRGLFFSAMVMIAAKRWEHHRLRRAFHDKRLVVWHRRLHIFNTKAETYFPRREKGD